jgi:hypothetical protein
MVLLTARQLVDEGDSAQTSEEIGPSWPTCIVLLSEVAFRVLLKQESCIYLIVARLVYTYNR